MATCWKVVWKRYQALCSFNLEYFESLQTMESNLRNKENYNTQNTLMTNDATRTARKEKHDNNTKESLFK